MDGLDILELLLQQMLCSVACYVIAAGHLEVRGADLPFQVRP